MRALFAAIHAARRPAAALLLALAAQTAAAQTAEVQIRAGVRGAADADGAIQLSTAEGSRTYPRFQIRLSAGRTRSVPLTLRRAGSIREGRLYEVYGERVTAFTGPLVFAGVRDGSSRWATFEVRPADDDIYDGDRSYTLTFAAPASSANVDRRYRAQRVSVTVVNADDEAPPEVTLKLTPTGISERGPGNAARVTATLNRISLVPVRVAVSAAAVSPAAAGDFALSRSRTLTFREDRTASSGTVTITAVDNDVASPTRYVTVTGTATIGAAPPQVRRLRLGIADDDRAGLAVTEAASPRAVTTEAGGRTAFKVALTSEPTAAVAVAVRSSDPGEGAASPASLTFTAGNWNTPQRVTVTGADDAAVDGDQHYAVTLDPSSGGQAGDAYYQRLDSVSVPMTNRDDDAPAGAPPAPEPEPNDDGDDPGDGDPPGDGSDPPGDGDNPGDGDPPGDDDRPGDGDRPGDDGDRPGDDDTPGDDGGTPGDNSAGRAQVTLALSAAAISEGGAGNRAAVTATLDRPAAAAFRVLVSIDAAAEVAALSANRALTFAAGATASAGAVTITAADDDVDAPDRRLAVSGRVAAAAPADGPADVALAIADDEPTPQVSLSLSPALILEAGGASSVAASLSGPSSAATAVTVAAAALGSVATADFRLPAARTLVIPAGSTASSSAVTITAVDNELIAPDQRVAVTARAANAHAVQQPARAVLVIADDDGATVALPGGRGQARLSLSLAPAAIDENGANNRSVVTAALSRAPEAAVAVTVSIDAAADAARLSAGRTLTFAPGATASAGTVTVTAVDNAVADGARAVVVSGTPAGGGRPARAALTIRDDEAPSAAVRLSLDPPRVLENAGPTPILLQARLNGAPRRQATVVTVGLHPDDAGTATVGEDYAAFAPAAITIPAGAASGRGTLHLIPAYGPDTAEPAETIRLAGAAPGLTVEPVLTLTLVDLNSPPIADAGAPQRGYPGMRLALDGSGSRDPEREPLDYAWVQVGGPAVTLMEPTAARPEFRTPPARLLPLSAAAGPGLGAREARRYAVLEFQLIVTDARGARSGADTTRVVVEEEPTTAAATAPPPVADAGDDQRVPEGATVTLDGSGSRGLGTLAYAWTQLPGGPRVALSDPAAARPTFAVPAGMPAAAVLEFGLVVTAGGQSSAPDTVRITVADATDAPVADAGPDQTGIAEGAAVRLDGSGSVGAHALRYAWTQLPGGPRVALSDPAAARPRFAAPADLRRMTALEFGLVVTDAVNGRSSAQDTVRITVYGVNDAPLADAGPDQDDLEEDAAVRLDGSGSRDPEGDAIAFHWRQRRGPPVALSSAASARPAFRAPAALAARAVLEFELMVTDVHGRSSAPDTVRITVRARAEERLARVMPTLLPEAARTLADGRAEAVRRRLADADRAGAPEAAALPGLLEEYGPRAQDGGLEWKRALADAAFALPLDADRAGGVTLWGHGDYRDLDGSSRGLEWDGEAAAAHLGADRLLANGWRAGLAVSWSEAKFDYTDAADGERGDWDLEMTSVQPYLGGTAGGGIDVWATAAFGSGDLDVADDELGGAAQTADADMWMAALGAAGPLGAAGGMELSLRGEALYANFEVDGNGDLIRRHAADVSRLRLALEAAWERRLAQDARLAPRLELGVRHDGGDGETGAGVELGGGAEYVAGRLTLRAGARALAANSDYDEWGAEAALDYAPGADGRGLSFRVAPSWGAARGGVRELWERGAPGLRGAAAEAGPAGRLEAALGYGLKSPFGRGLLQLELGSALSAGDGGSCRLAGVAALDAATRIGLELEFRGSKSDGSGYSLMLTGELRF